MKRQGRNQPCYCGSGIKYKLCCMKKDQAAEQEKRAISDAVSFVRRDLLKFARDDQFAEDFAKALPYYWDNLYELENAEEMSQDEALRFFDWFVFDYQPEGEDAKRLIDLYVVEERENLSSAQQKVIDGWQDAPPSGAYELLAYEGQNLTLADYFSGEQFEVF
ncbi:MAG: SEC-C domain-containing protein, partial [Chloroflexota bacterium]